MWTRTFISLSIANFFVGLVYYLTATTIAGYTMDNFGVGASKGGIIVGIFALGALCARVITGPCMHQVGLKKLSHISLFFFMVFAACYLIADSFWALGVLRFLHGACFGIANTTMSTIVLMSLPIERQGEGTAIYTMSATVSTAIGPFIGMVLTQSYPYEVIMWICVACGVVAFAMVAVGGIAKDKKSDVRIPVKETFSPKNLFEASAIPVSLVILMLAMCYGTSTSFMKNFAESIGLTKAASVFFLVYSLAIFISRPLTGKLLDKKYDNYVVYPSLVIYIVGFVLMGTATSSIALLGAAVCFGFGYGAYMSNGQAIAVKYTTHERIGLATATYYAFIDVGMAVGPFLFGNLEPLIGYRGMFLSLTVVVAIGIVIYYVFHGRIRGKLTRKEAEKLYG